MTQMLEKIAHTFAGYIMARSKGSGEDEEIIEYGITLFLSTAMGVISIFIISAIFFDIYAAAVFLVIFIPLRKCSGGYHCSTYSACFILSNLLFTAVMLLAQVSVLWQGYYIPAAAAALLSMLCIVRYAPVINKNNPIGKKLQCKNRKKAIWLSAVYCACIVSGLIVFRHSTLGFYMCVAAYAISVVAVLIIAVKIHERRNKDA